LKPERWGSLLVQEKYQEEMPVTGDIHNNNNNNNNRQKNKYQELAKKICAMWKQKVAQMIPIAISSTGVIPKSLSQSLTTLNLHPNTYIQLPKFVILGTCSIVRNF
jgi:hypothetical protein